MDLAEGALVETGIVMATETAIGTVEMTKVLHYVHSMS